VETLYRCDLLHDDPEQTLADVLKRRRMPERSAEYCRRLVIRTLEGSPMIDEAISATLIHWKLERLSYLDRAILRMACCELLYVDDVPTTVSINEAVELAKLFGDEKSAQFVNGVLDAIAKMHPRGGSGQEAPGREPITSGEGQQV
jgi:N utilization substance protein B